LQLTTGAQELTQIGATSQTGTGSQEAALHRLDAHLLPSINPASADDEKTNEPPTTASTNKAKRMKSTSWRVKTKSLRKMYRINSYCDTPLARSKSHSIPG
jgi:hypothetical protein